MFDHCSLIFSKSYFLRKLGFFFSTLISTYNLMTLPFIGFGIYILGEEAGHAIDIACPAPEEKHWTRGGGGGLLASPPCINETIVFSIFENTLKNSKTCIYRYDEPSLLLVILLGPGLINSNRFAHLFSFFVIHLLPKDFYPMVLTFIEFATIIVSLILLV